VKIKRTRHLLPTVFLIISCGPCIALAAQPPAAPSPTPQQTLRTPSAIMQPAIETLRQTIWILRPEKWKASDAIRQETSANIDSIHRDLTNTLPSLLTAADQTPDSVSRMLPAYRNIEALYDVLLRVTEAGRLSAPRDQAVTLQRALAGLEGGRRAFAEQMQSAAVAHDQQLRSLEAAARAAPRAVVATPAPCPPAPHTKKRRTTSKTVRKPMHPSTSKTTGTASH